MALELERPWGAYMPMNNMKYINAPWPHKSLREHPALEDGGRTLIPYQM